RVGPFAPSCVIARLLAASDLLRAHLLQLLLAAVAPIGFTAGNQFFDHILVAVEALGLKERPLVVDESRPFETIQDLLDGLGGRALKICVLDPQNKGTRMTARV